MNFETRRVMFSSKSTTWKTPQELMNELDQEFHFTLDVAPTNPTKDMLKESWKGNICYMNPPYGRDIAKWLEKAWIEMITNNVLTVALLPVRTDTLWFWNYCIDREIRLIKGRVRFINEVGDEMPAPFPSMIVIFKQ